jgi:putative tricarboxylic transport membrane protein
LVLAYVLGPMLEQNLRQGLILSDGSFWIFVSRPISAACLVITFILLISAVLPSLQKKRRLIAVEE